MTAVAEPELVEQQLTVTQLNGHPMVVMSQAEVDFFEDLKTKYRAEHAFTAATDLNDLDRLIALELRMFRMDRHLNSGQDYDGTIFTDAAMLQMSRQTKVINEQILAIKTGLGLTRSARDKAKGESIGDYITELARRAKEFGIMRENQLTRALTLVHEQISLVETFDRANDHERRTLGFDTEADIVEWIRQRFIPEFREIDDYFRANSQRYWAGTL